MDDTALMDLARKIQNTVRDFEHEQAANGVEIHLIVTVGPDAIAVQVDEPYTIKTLPVEDMLTPREQEDYRARRSKK